MTASARTIDRPLTAADYITAAEGIAKNIEQHEVDTGHGIYWKNDHFEEQHLDFYFGASGIALFLAQLGEATGKSVYLDKAKQAADYLVYKVETADTAVDALAIAGSTLEKDSAGQISYVAYVLYQISEITGVAKYRDVAEQIFAENVASVQTTAHGTLWTGNPDIEQDGGAALFLALAAKWFGHPEWIDTAVAVGDALLASEVAYGTDSARYPGYVNILDRVFDGKWKDRFFTGFAHGASSVGYVFAGLYEVSGEDRFLEAAKKTANYLESIAEPFGEGTLVPYTQPNPDNLFYISYCHGSDGNGRLYYKLYQLTGEQHYLDFYRKLVDGVTATGAPEVHSSGYWNNYSLCCGTAGLLHLYSTAWLVTGDDTYKALADRTTNAVLGDGVVTEDGTYLWYQAWSRQDPAEVSNDISLRAGDAGVGQALIEYASLVDPEAQYVVRRQPDDPFPSSLESVEAE